MHKKHAQLYPLEEAEKHYVKKSALLSGLANKVQNMTVASRAKIKRRPKSTNQASFTQFCPSFTNGKTARLLLPTSLPICYLCPHFYHCSKITTNKAKD